MFDWITQLITQNDKYSDIVILNNFCYIEQYINTNNFPILVEFLKHSGQKIAEAEARYVLWMVTYELPSLSELATRLEGVGARVREEELSLYVRR